MKKDFKRFFIDENAKKEEKKEKVKPKETIIIPEKDEWEKKFLKFKLYIHKLKAMNQEEEEDSEDFYYYCYNDNSNSTNSYSTKSFNDNKNSIDKNKKNSIDSQSLQKEKGNSIKSQKIKYNNILDELSQSISSSKSNFTLNKINLYAKKTHKTKFGDKKENK